MMEKTGGDALREGQGGQPKGVFGGVKMRKKKKTLWQRIDDTAAIWLAIILLPVVLLSAWKLWNRHACGQYLENWGGEGFLSYTGRCTEVYFDLGFEGVSKYSWLVHRGYQDFTGQGWHLILDNGKGYYIPEEMEKEMPHCNTDSLDALVGKEVTVLCLPETAMPSMNLMVYLESGGEVYLTEDASQRYLRQKITDLPRGVRNMWMILSPILLLGLVVVWFDIDSARNRRKKERRKQENMQRLREQDLLHPKNQRRKKAGEKKP